jgi:uncharacterized protein YbjQ (UPF0145 family)
MTMSDNEPSVSVVTTETIPGFRIVQSLGYVEGSGPAIQGTPAAITAMIQQAAAKGANAVVGVRWSHFPLGAMSTGVGHVGALGLVYGTAVLIQAEAS